jgi:hypothetical protein
VQDIHDERVMTDDLLGALDEETRERVGDRLGADEGYFESMAGLEDDLILRWLRGDLPADRAALFARAYADPARRARVDATRVLLHAADTWKEQEEAGFKSRFLMFLTSLRTMPRLAIAGTCVAAVAALAFWAQPASRRAASDTRTFAVTLTAVGEKDPRSPGFDRIDLPRDAETLALTVQRSTVLDGARLVAQITALDRGAVLRLGPPSVGQSTAATTAWTVTVATADLPDGDYVLTLRHDAADAAEPVASQAFRVRRQPR